MEYKIHWATEQDAKALRFIHSQAWRIAYKGIIPDDILDKSTK
ncbi:MAG: hypothetical protein ACYCYE_07865 [Clostridia bacterium]